MKRTNIFTFTLILGAAAVFGAVRASAQAGVAPDGQLGIGVVGASYVGASIQYAVSPSLQLGADLGLHGMSSNGASSTDLNFELYGRFLLEGKVNPLIQAAYRRHAGSPDDVDQVYAGLGLEYFFNRNVGVYGMFEVITLTLGTPSVTEYGINSPRIGLEWYFDK